MVGKKVLKLRNAYSKFNKTNLKVNFSIASGPYQSGYVHVRSSYCRYTRVLQLGSVSLRWGTAGGKGRGLAEWPVPWLVRQLPK